MSSNFKRSQTLDYYSSPTRKSSTSVCVPDCSHKQQPEVGKNDGSSDQHTKPQKKFSTSSIFTSNSHRKLSAASIIAGISEHLTRSDRRKRTPFRWKSSSKPTSEDNTPTSPSSIVPTPKYSVPSATAVGKPSNLGNGGFDRTTMLRASLENSSDFKKRWSFISKRQKWFSSSSPHEKQQQQDASGNMLRRKSNLELYLALPSVLQRSLNSAIMFYLLIYHYYILCVWLVN